MKTLGFPPRHDTGVNLPLTKNFLPKQQESATCRKQRIFDSTAQKTEVTNQEASDK